MVEQIMFFALGALSAGLISIAVLPAFWRRAERLVRGQLERQLPLSPREIAAERDQLRAEFAVKQQISIQKVESAQLLEHQSKVQIGGYLLSIARLGDEKTALNTHIDELNGQISDRNASIEHLNATIVQGEALLEDNQKALNHRINEHLSLEQMHQTMTQLAVNRATDIEHHKNIIANLEHSLASSQTDHAQTQKELSDKNDLHIDLQNAYARMSSLSNERRLEISNLTNALDLACVKIEEQQTAIADLKLILQAKSHEAVQLQRNLTDETNAHLNAQTRLEAALNLAARRQETIEAKNDTLQSKSSALSDTSQQMALLRAELSQEINARKRLERQAETLEKRIVPLQEGIETTKRQSQETARDLSQTIDILRAKEKKILNKIKVKTE